MSQINYGANFDGNDLTTVSGLTVLATDGYKPPKRKINIYPLTRTNKSHATSAFYNKRQVTVRVALVRATRDLLEQSIDALMILLQGVEKELVLSQSGTLRRFYCTLSDTVTANDGGSYIQIDLVFECSDNFGYDLAPSLVLSSAGNTAVPYTATVTVGGSALWQAPVYLFTISALTGGTLKDVIVGNQTTGQLITVNRTWLAGDVLAVDCYNRTVKVNGAVVAFTGAFPDISPGSAVLYYTDTLSTRTMTAYVTCVNRYLQVV